MPLAAPWAQRMLAKRFDMGKTRPKTTARPIGTTPL
jgi:hypothetical protein